MDAKTVGEVVKGRPVYIVQEEDSVLDAARYMTEYRVGAVPVLSEGTLVGLFTQRDLMTRVVAPGLEAAKVKVGKVMTTRVAVLDMDSSCSEAVAIMNRLQVDHLPVISAGRLVGCVSLNELQGKADGNGELEIEFLDESMAKKRRRKMHESSDTLADRVRAIPGGEHLYMCYSCGTCVGTCMLQRVEPTYNPRRLMQKVARGMEDEAFEDKTSWLCSACDLCYPACPQEIHISGVLLAVRELAAEAGYDTPLKTAVVNEQTCVACGLCVEVCPYEAITLVEKHIAGQDRVYASVDANKCMACGLCAASCRSTSIELRDEYSSQALMDDLWGWIQETEPVPAPMVEIPERIRAVSGQVAGAAT